MTDELRQHLISTSGYDSEETIIYNPGEITPSNTAHDVSEPKRPKVRKSKKSATEIGFHISVHGIKCKKTAPT